MRADAASVVFGDEVQRCCCAYMSSFHLPTHVSCPASPAADVQPEERLAVSGIQAAQLASGELVATFQLELDTPTGTGELAGWSVSWRINRLKVQDG